MWGFFKIKSDKLDQKTLDSEIVIGGNVLKGELQVFSSTWIFVRDYATEEIQRLREKNDALTADPIKTAIIRGEIKALKALIDLPNERKRRGLIAPADEEE